MLTPLPDHYRAHLGDGETDTRFLVEGRHAVRALLETATFPVEAVIATGRVPEDFLVLAERRRVPVFGWSREEAADLLGFTFHRGVLALARKPVQDFITWFRKEAPSRLVILENLADPGNVGTIVRNSVAFGFEGVIMVGGGASPYNAKAVRASSTAIFQIPVFTLPEVLPWLSDLTLIGAEVASGTRDLDDALRQELLTRTPLAIVLGSEADGLSDRLRDACHFRVRIRISSRVESLNVASASAILLNALGTT